MIVWRRTLSFISIASLFSILSFINIVSFISIVSLPSIASDLSSIAPEKTPLLIGVYENYRAEIQQAIKSGHCPKVRDYDFTEKQALGEFLLFCQALRIGGLDAELNAQGSPAYIRLVRELKNAHLSALGFAVWAHDVDEKHFYVTRPLLRAGDFVKGLYALPGNKKALAVTHKSQLKHFTVAANPNWFLDKATINCLGLQPVSAPNYVSMFRIVAAKRADFVLVTFPQTQDLTITDREAGISLVPVPHIKIVLREALHFVVSKSHPRGLEVFNALQKGLAVLEKDGTVAYVYETLGFFNPVIKDWDAIGCEAGDN